MANNQQFNRLIVLEVYKRNLTNTSSGNALLQNVDKEGTAFSSRQSDGSSGFRIKFKVQKPVGLTPIPNPGDIWIWNVSAEHRALLTDTNNLVILKAGYGESATLLFVGNIYYTVTKKEGADYVTHIQAYDGLAAFQGSTVNQSFSKGTSFATLFNTMIESMKGAGIEKGVVKGIPSGGFNQGVVVTGGSPDKLAEFCDKFDLHSKIENGKVQIIPYGSSKGNPPILLSPDTGLIGIPEVKAKGLAPGGESNPQASHQTQISFKCLLNPGIETFSVVIIESKFINGAFVTTHVEYTGDSWGEEFFTEAEAFQPLNYTKATA